MPESNSWVSCRFDGQIDSDIHYILAGGVDLRLLRSLVDRLEDTQYIYFLDWLERQDLNYKIYVQYIQLKALYISYILYCETITGYEWIYNYSYLVIICTPDLLARGNTISQTIR